MSRRSITLIGALTASVLGCVGRSGAPEGGATIQGQVRGAPEESARSPVEVTWLGEGASGQSQLQLTARVRLLAPLVAPLSVSVEVPAGVTLVTGPQKFSIPPTGEPSTHDTPYVFEVRGTTSENLKLVADVQTASFGIHAVDEYRFGRPAPVGPRPKRAGPRVKVAGYDFGATVAIEGP